MAATQQILRDLLEKIAIKLKYKNYELNITPIKTCGVSNTSEIFTATISEGTKELNVFAKVAAMGVKMRSETVIQYKFDTERFFYTKLANAYRQLEEKKSIPIENRLKIPIFYGCNETKYEETYVLENLSVKGYISFDRFKTVTWEYAVSAVAELAKFHALSVVYYEENPKEFEKMHLEHLNLDIHVRKEDNVQIAWGLMIKKAVDKTKEENRERLRTFLNSEFNTTPHLKFKAPGKLSIIGHGDYKPSNLMYKSREDGSVDIIIVDYQDIGISCPTVDLLYFIVTGTDKQFRAQHFQQLVDHYYSEFRAALTRFGLNPDEKYCRQDFDTDLKQKLPLSLGMAVFTLPIITADADMVPKTGANIAMMDFVIEKTSSLFSERFNDLVDDYVAWGVI